MTVASASRNSILHRYCVQRERHVTEIAEARARTDKLKHMNYMALARRERPDLVKRPRGRLWFEGDVSEEEMRATVHSGDPVAFTNYVAENRERLVAEASLLRERGKRDAHQSAQSLMPYTIRQWLEYLDSHADDFHKKLREAPTLRRSLSKRLVPPQLFPPAPRLQARSRKLTQDTTWKRKLMQQRSGYASLRWGTELEHKAVFFFAGHAGECRFLPLVNSPLGTNRFVLNLSIDFDTAFLTTEQFLSAPFMQGFQFAPEEQVTVWKLRFGHPEISAQGIAFQVVGREVIQLQARARRSTGEAADTESEEVSTEEDPFACLTSDAESVQSPGESSAEDIKEEGEGATSQSSEEEGPKAPAGTYSSNNGYFSITDHPSYKDIRVKVLPQWAKDPTDGGMGLSNLQKQAQPNQYDADASDPKRTRMVLHAWMLKRFQDHGFANARAARLSWLATEKAKLSLSIRSLDVVGGGTGHAKADRVIRAWLPEALQGS